VYRLGPFAFSARTLALGLLFAVCVPQALYLASRNVTLVTGGFSWHHDSFLFGSGGGNAGNPGNPAPRTQEPYLQGIGAEPIAQALGIIHGAVNQRMSFEPSTARRAFTVGMTDVGEIYFLPALMDELAKVASGVRMRTVRTTAINLRDEMEAGRVDLAIGLLPQLKAGFLTRRLFKQRYVCMFRKGHRLDKRKVTLAEFCSAKHVVVVSEGTGHGKVDELMERSGLARDVVLTGPHFVAVGQLLHHSDMVATVPERLAQALVGRFDLAYVSHPASLPEIAINVFWHAKYHKDPANEWLRGLVFRVHSD
jgi:DNA-binding transcriptional LysR family regulator